MTDLLHRWTKCNAEELQIDGKRTFGAPTRGQCTCLMFSVPYSDVKRTMLWMFVLCSLSHSHPSLRPPQLAQSRVFANLEPTFVWPVTRRTDLSFQIVCRSGCSNSLEFYSTHLSKNRASARPGAVPKALRRLRSREELAENGSLEARLFHKVP